MRPDHPRQRLLFFFTEEPTDAVVQAFHALMDQLASDGPWSVGSPQYVDEIDDSDLSAGDSPVHTIGGVLELYSAHPPWGEYLPKQMDACQLDECKRIVNSLIAFSQSHGCEFTLSLENQDIGEISHGHADYGVSEIFLAEWERALAQRS